MHFILYTEWPKIDAYLQVPIILFLFILISGPIILQRDMDDIQQGHRKRNTIRETLLRNWVLLCPDKHMFSPHPSPVHYFLQDKYMNITRSISFKTEDNECFILIVANLYSILCKGLSIWEREEKVGFCLFFFSIFFPFYFSILT